MRSNYCAGTVHFTVDEHRNDVFKRSRCWLLSSDDIGPRSRFPKRIGTFSKISSREASYEFLSEQQPPRLEVVTEIEADTK